MSQNSQKLPQKANVSLSLKLACGAVMTALSVVLMYMEVALPFMPPFLKFDFSEIPVLVGSFTLGPWYGVAIELLKNLIHLPVTATSGIGEMSNFITGSIYVFTAGAVYSRKRTMKGAIIAMTVGTIALAVIACPFNYFITLPLYGSICHFTTEAIVGMSQAVNPYITDKTSLILWGFLPFNIFKGAVVGFFTFWIYKPISRLINSIHEKTHKKS
ncbi:MAG: ECF transporter S component [Clostridiales bacterium]|nr:ECF transporter S component [Clostridiales bacterium]